MTQRRILLIDGSSLAFRAFFSISDLDRFQNQSGLHTNAIFSFKRMLDNVLDQFDPTHVLVAFDKSNVTFRTQKYADYKLGRQKTPSEFREQLPYFRVLLDGYGIPYYDLLNYEADDIIGTLAHQASEEDQVIILSGDKDLTQLAADHRTVYITRRGVSDLEAYTPATIQEKWGISPQQIIDMKGLMGDTSDNYPGVRRIGEKTALKLLHQFGSVEALYEQLDELKPSKMKENLIADKDQAFLSKDLAQIHCQVPLEIGLEDLKRKEVNSDLLLKLYQEMDFRSFLKDMVDSSPSHQLTDTKAQDVPYKIQWVSEITPSMLVDKVAYYSETLDDNYHFAPIEAIAWYDYQNHQVYVTEASLAFESPIFCQWLSNPDKEKIFYDYKREAVLASRYDCQVKGLDMDIQLARYLVDTNNQHRFKEIAEFIGSSITIQDDEVIYGKGSKKKIPSDKELFYQHLAYKLQILYQAKGPLKDQLNQVEMTQLYDEMEIPLAKSLAQTEITGVKVDRQILEDKDRQLQVQLDRMQAEIHEMAGGDFNLNSPKQLGEVLFERLELPVIKKTKTGYSTAADVLEKLIDHHPIIQAILDYRQLAKLQSTYLKGLPPFIKEDGKIHTRYVQTLTQTGRLSSTDPNLQNIPIRIEEGRLIRQAFVPAHEDWQMFGADYSQIELRVLAHMAQDEHMIQAFIEGEDIHSTTARRVFGLAAEEPVSSEHRRQAKAVNFGIVYGISDYGLSQNLNIPRKEAKKFIDRYFDQFPKIADYMEEIVQSARTHGYVQTLFNRRRYLPDIHASNFNIRSFTERTAMNSPIQGTAADIIKIAMVNLNKALDQEELKSRIILQVHDELILEGPRDEMERLEVLVPQVMESACNLSVPLKVDYHIGDNWYDLK